MAKITYTNKVALNVNPEIADINKVKDSDMNEIKSVVNTNADNLGDLTTLTTTAKNSTVAAINELNSNKASTNEVLIQNTEPTAADNKIWIDTGEIASPVSEITNSYSTSTGIGYSANFINGDVLFETDDQNPLGISDNITLSASIDNYRMIEIQYNRYGYLGYVKVPTDIRLSTAPNSILVNCDLSLFANNILRIYTTTYVLSGTSMSRSSYTYWNTNQGAPTANAENQLTVTKVIGYK